MGISTEVIKDLSMFNKGAPYHPLFEAVKKYLRLKNDRQLAKVLKVLPSGISKIRRSGRVPAQWIIDIHKVTKWPIERIEFLAQEKWSQERIDYIEGEK